MTRADRRVRGSVPGGRGSAVGQWAGRRHVYLDNLKVLMIAAIIAVHGVIGYSEAGWWSYADVREVTIAPATEAVLLAVLGPAGLFAIALLFLVAGLLTPASLQRKGPRRFTRDRLLRLGVPFALFTLVLQPTLLYALYHPLGAAPGSYWYEYLGAEGQLDTGPLWFAGVLLLFSLGYVTWTWRRPERDVRRRPAPITLRHLLLIAAAVAPASFLIRLAYPYGGDSGFTDLNLWQWPVCAALFGLGIAAARRGWLGAVPDRLRRQSRTVALAAVGVFLTLAAVTETLGVYDQMWGGWHWPALAFAAVEAVLNVFGPVWLLGAAQRHLDRPFRWAAPAAARSAYGAFFVQGLVLIGLAVTLRPLPLPAEVKALAVAAGAVVASFALAWLLISRTRAVARIL